MYVSSAPNLNIGLGVYLMHSVARSPARLVVQEVALYKHAVFTHTPNPHLTFVLLVQYHSWKGGREGGREGEGWSKGGREGWRGEGGREGGMGR